jgi:hypothetical protein
MMESLPVTTSLGFRQDLDPSVCAHPLADPGQKSATSSTLERVPSAMPIVTTDTFAKAALNLDMADMPAQKRSEDEVYGMRPKYLRYNLWHPGSDLPVMTAEWSEQAPPLPRPPSSELNNPIVNETITKHPNLFKIVTPIKVEVFERLLHDHPNPAFVRSVVQGLTDGFWPWADTQKPGYPTTHNACPSNLACPDPKKAAFLAKQVEIERNKQRFSDNFGTELLPGMYCMPVYAVPKPDGSDFRMITDQSSGEFSLNSMIDREDLVKYPLDNLAQLGEFITLLHQTFPGEEFVAWKSDVAEAYRLMPLHPCWQIKQANFINGCFHIDRNNAFGGRASGGIFVSFMCLVLWIAKNVRRIPFIAGYVDDDSSVARKNDVSYYAPYNKLYPPDQVRLLTLWDDLGIPHKERKQIYGREIPIIGILVNPTEMTLTLPDEAKARFIKALREWSAPNSRFPLQQWQEFAGWFNWALNIYPLLRPALNNFYPKMSSKAKGHQNIWVNNVIREDFQWALRKVENSTGIHLLTSVSWSISDATVMVYCDASPCGLGFWFPATKQGFYCKTPSDLGINLIFYYEALCVLCALRHASLQYPVGSRIVLYTDNFNTVSIFCSLRCLPDYNLLLREAVNLVTEKDNDFRVLHIEGKKNDVADALSRWDFNRALALVPDLMLTPFEPYIRQKFNARIILQPPREELGANL